MSVTPLVTLFIYFKLKINGWLVERGSYQSIGFFLYIVRITFGAIHRGVPTHIQGGHVPAWAIQHTCKVDLSGTALSKWQSFTVGVPSSLFLSKSNSMFSLFMSRWIMCFECSSDKAHETSLAICKANSTRTCFSPASDSFSR